MKLALTVALATVLLALATSAWLALADQGNVTGTAHDLGSSGAGGVSSCETCHVPHEVSGAAIWEEGPSAGGTFAGLTPACYSCHDGTVATGSYVFDSDAVQHPLDREAGKDCNMCHDPHVSDYGSFLLFPSGANLCQACHEHASENDHPVNVNLRDAGFAPLDTQWDPDKGDVSGTRLWDVSGRAGSEYTKCLTCHSAHAGTSESFLTIGPDIQAGISSALCQNCHRGEVDK